MSLKFSKYLLLLILIPVFGVSQDLPEGGEDILNKDQIRLLREKQKADNLFFDANRAKLTDQPEKAFRLFKECVENDPSNDAAWYELSQLYYASGDAAGAIDAASKAYGLVPGNTWYSLSLAILYQNNNQFEEAKSIYEILLRNEPGNIDYAFDLANIWLKLNKPQEAIKVYDQMESKLGVNEDLSMRKHKIYLATGKSKKALEELEKLAKANNWDSRILSMLAEYYNLEGKQEEALKTYKRIQEVDPENPYINISLADFYRQRGDLKMAMESLKKGFANPYLDSDTKIQVMMSYFSQIGEYDDLQSDITELSLILVELHPNEPKVMMFRGEVLMFNENYQEAITVYQKLVEQEPGTYQIWENLLRALAITEDNVSLAKYSEQATGLFPMQPLPYYFNGVSNYLLKKYDDAVKALNSGVKLVAGDKKLISDFYSLIGDAYHSAGNSSASYEAYEKALKAVPENALVLNNYAYHLSLEAAQLDKAAEMAQKALQLDPGNSYYLDTYAWVLYKQGDYSKALNYIEQALNAGKEDSATVLEHYGDILYRLNRKEEAFDKWKKAAEAGEGSKFLESKIKDSKLYE